MKSTIQTTLLGDAMQSAKTNKKNFLKKWIHLYRGKIGFQ